MPHRFVTTELYAKTTLKNKKKKEIYERKNKKKNESEIIY